MLEKTKRELADSIKADKTSLCAAHGLKEMLESIHDGAGCGCNGTGGPGNGSCC